MVRETLQRHSFKFSEHHLLYSRFKCKFFLKRLLKRISHVIMADNHLSSQEACCESGCEEEALSKITEKDDSRVKTHKNEDVDFLPAGRIPSDEDKEHNQSLSSLPKIEEESSDQQPSQEPELLLKLSEKGIVERVMSILDKDPSLVNCKDSDSYTPLHRASYNGHADVVRVLLQRGADVDARTEDGWQPLHCACRWGKTDVASLLLQNGADINSQTNGKQTPLHFAASGIDAATTLQLLLCNRWLDATLLNMQNETAYDIAKRSGKHHVLFEMVEDSINVK